MSTTVDERVVEMRFDNKQFEQNIQTSLSTIDKLKNSLKFEGATKGLESVNSAAQKCDFSPLSSAVESVKIKFSALEVMAVTALSNITNSAINVGERIVSALTIDPIKSGLEEYETQINAVQTILANTSSKGTTLQQVNNALDELNHYADMTIYNFTEMTRNIGTFTAAGVDLNTSVAAIKGIANLAAVSGSTSQQASTAMYQLSQALAAGTVKLQDWNSVVNAGMGGQVFQDALKETAKVHGIAIDEMIADEGSFRETLSKGWLTSEILTETLSKFTGDLNEEQLRTMGYTDDQIQAIIKMGQTASDAATKVKTFTQLFDTLKEAAQSGWTESWEIIIGDFGEAKETLTKMSDTFGDIIQKTADNRNNLLLGGLATGWKQLLKQGIADEAGYMEAIQNVARINGDAFDKMVENSEDFSDALKKGLNDGVISSDTLTQAVYDLQGKMSAMSEEERDAAGYTYDMVEQIETLASGLRNGSVSMDEFSKKIIRSSGRENLIDSLWNSFNAILSVINPVKDAFRDIFPAPTAEQLYQITANLKDFTAQLTLSETNSNNLKRTFKGIFAILDIVGQAFKAVANGVGEVVGLILPAGNGILSLTGNFGEYLVKLDETIKQTDIFDKAISTTVKIIEMIVTAMKIAGEKVIEFGKAVAVKFDFQPFEAFHSFLERIHERMSQVGEAAGSMKSVIVTTFELMGDALEKCKFTQVLQALWNTMKAIGSAIGNLFGSLISSFGNADFNGVIDLLNGIATGGLSLAISKFLNSKLAKNGIFGFLESLVRGSLKQTGDLLDGVKGVLDGVRESFEAYQTNLKVGMLLKIGAAIALLAGSIVVISTIDSDKLSASLGAITVLFANLLGAMAIFNKISGSIGKTAKACATMIAMSISVSILAGALKKVAELDWGEIARGLTGIAGLSAIVVAAAKVISKDQKHVMKGTTGLVIFAAAIKILASACKDLATLSWEEMKNGLIGVGVLMGEVSLFLRTAKLSGKAITTATGVVILAAAMKILASACKDFGELDVEVILKGMSGIGVVLSEVALFTNASGYAKHVVSSAVALTIMGAAMKIFASATKDFGTIPIEQLVQGLSGIGVALGIVALAINLIPKNAIAIGAGLVVVGGALEIMVDVMSKIGSMDTQNLVKAVSGMGIALGEVALSLNLMRGTLGGSAALLVASAALAVLAPVLSVLGAMSVASIAKALITLAGAFTIIGVAGAALTPLIPSIIALSGAFALIGVGVLALGAGLLAAGAGLSSLAIGLTALAGAGAAGATAIVASLTVIITGIYELIPMLIAQLGQGIVALCKVIEEGAPAIGAAITAIILAVIDMLVESIPSLVDGLLQLLTEVMDSLVTYTPQIVDLVFKFLIGVIDGIANNLPALIKVAIDLLMSFFTGIVDALKSIDTSVLLNGIVGIGLLSAIMVALSATATLVPGAMVGILGMGAVMAEMALVLAAIGALAQLPGLSWLIGEGGKLLQSVGTAIGQFVGGIVGGFMSGVSSQFPQIGADLSAFMINVTPFIVGASMIKPSMMDGVKALAETILILTAADILQGVTSWITGGASLSKFGEELVPFGDAMREFAVAIGDLDGDVVAQAAIAGKTLAEMAATLPNSGGVAGFFAGNNDMDAFGTQLESFGEAMVGFSKTVVDLKADAIQKASIAGKALSELASTLPNTGGVVSWFTGNNDMDTFGAQLEPFGKAMFDFGEAVNGIKAEAIMNSATAGKALLELANTVPNTGGVVSWFTGNNDMDVFGEQLKAFGEAMTAYSDSIHIDPDAIANSATAGKALIELANTLPNTGGVVSWFTGDNDMGTFGEQLKAFGESIKGYSDSVADIQMDAMSSVITEVNRLVDMANGMASVDTGGMNGFSMALIQLGNVGIDEFINNFSNAGSRISTAATNMITNFISGINAKKPDFIATFTLLNTSALTTITNSYIQFLSAGSMLMTRFIDGIKTQESSARITLLNIVSSCITAINNQQERFRQAGAYLVAGFANGISENTYLAEARSREMASAAISAAKSELDEHSPSKVAYRIGDFFGLGFVNAIGTYGDKAYNASKEMAQSAKDGLNRAIAKVTAEMNDDIDSQPTIRPVLDLSDVESKSQRLNALFSRSQALSISTGIKASRDQEIQNEAGNLSTGNSYNFVQNNYSPKALSRIEIYRQTRNQFSAMKEVTR